MEKKIQREREMEKGEFDDKEAFVTAQMLIRKNCNREPKRRKEKRGLLPSKHVWM